MVILLAIFYHASNVPYMKVLIIKPSRVIIIDFNFSDLEYEFNLFQTFIFVVVSCSALFCIQYTLSLTESRPI